MRWHYRGGFFDLSDRTLVMGVLNATPDSFSDGGTFTDVESAVSRGVAMTAEGADIIDIGGESTRPGAEAVSVAGEMERVIPVIKELSGKISVPISIDTSKAEVADAAMKAGARIINDVSGLGDPAMADVVRQTGAGLVIMHMKGTPRTMQDEPVYTDVVAEVGAFLRERVEAAVRAGIPAEHMVVDPGIGFGKTLEHNVELLRALDKISAMAQRPLLLGVSRKRFIGAITGREVHDRLAGSLAAAAFGIQRGARIIRVHDVKESCDIARMIDKLNP
jgi:dihydropteroate synthase